MWAQMENSGVNNSLGKMYFLMCQNSGEAFPTVDSMANNTEQSGYWRLQTCDQTSAVASDKNNPLPAILHL